MSIITTIMMSIAAAAMTMSMNIITMTMNIITMTMNIITMNITITTMVPNVPADATIITIIMPMRFSQAGGKKRPAPIPAIF